MPNAPLTYVFQSHKKLNHEFVRIAGEISSKAAHLSLQTRVPIEDLVHDGRVLMKRLRTLLWFAKPVLATSVLKRTKAQLRMGAGLLADQRDLAVASKTLEALTTTKSKPERKSHLIKIAKEVAGAKVPARKQRLALQKAMAILRRCAAVVNRSVRSKAKWPSPKMRVRKAFRDMTRAEKKAERTKSDTDFHEWRKKAKRLYYLLELTSPNPDQRQKAALTQADNLQDVLGLHHDVVMVEALIRGKESRSTSEEHVLDLLRRRKAALGEKTRKIKIKL